jgi:hypothetical protein
MSVFTLLAWKTSRDGYAAVGGRESLTEALASRDQMCATFEVTALALSAEQHDHLAEKPSRGALGCTEHLALPSIQNPRIVQEIPHTSPL